MGYAYIKNDGTVSYGNFKDTTASAFDVPEDEIISIDKLEKKEDGTYYEFYLLEPVDGIHKPDTVKIQKKDRTVFKADFRAKRDAELEVVDIEINKAEDLGEDTAVLRKYRQDLRDATNTWIMPTKG